MAWQASVYFLPQRAPFSTALGAYRKVFVPDALRVAGIFSPLSLQLDNTTNTTTTATATTLALSSPQPVRQ